MKKLIAMFLAALTALSLTACAAKSGAQPDASEIPDALTILNTVWASYSEDEKFPAAGGDYSEANMTDGQRSEERRVGKECRSRWSPYH